MTRGKLVSIVMPAYNAEKYLPISVGSVLNQTYTNWELIIVNDGSVDDTETVAGKFAAGDERIRVVSRENGGAGRSRNTGLDNARGYYIYFLDSDDRIVPDAIEKLVTAAEENAAEIVCCGMRMVRFDTGAVEESFVPDLPKTVYTGDEVRDELLPETLASSPLAPKRNGLNVYYGPNLYAARLFDNPDCRIVSERELIYEDFYMKLNVFGEAKKAVIIPDILFDYLRHGNSLLLRYQANRFERCTLLYKAAENVCLSKSYNLETRKRVAWFYICTANVSMYGVLSNEPGAKVQLRKFRSMLRDPDFQKAVSMWDGAPFSGTRRLLFLTYKLKSGFLLWLLMRLQQRRM